MQTVPFNNIVGENHFNGKCGKIDNKIVICNDNRYCDMGICSTKPTDFTGVSYSGQCNSRSDKDCIIIGKCSWEDKYKICNGTKN